MRQARDIAIALSIGVVWALLIAEIVGFVAASSPGRTAEIDALASGASASFVAYALLRDVALYAVPSLLAGYLIMRLMDRPMLFALIAALPPSLYSAYRVGQVLLEGGLADVRGIYAVLNVALVLAAIPAGVALLECGAQLLPRTTPPASQ